MYRFIKRTFDIIFSLIGMILLSPLMLIFAILIKIESKGPVIFKQKRIGYKGKVFNIYKFRSMVVDAEKDGVYESKNDPRVTKIGRFIRRFSIDELPQFFNILKGDMSIIGPRPTLTYHPWDFEEYSATQKKRFNVRPGVTGWAQVNGRKDVEWNKRIEHDVYYVENISLWFDIKIFFKTIFKVILMKDNVNKGETVKDKLLAENFNNKLTLMYITNNPEIAKIAENSGVDWIFVDLEIKGKIERQGHLDTVISRHSISDITPIKEVLTKSKLLVRVNPINEDSEEEINKVINAGAEIIMLPFFKTAEEVIVFKDIIDARVETCLLLETPEAVNVIDKIIEVPGIDYIHIGLNDLHLGYKKTFMFELLVDGTVGKLSKKFRKNNIKFGIGGVAQIGEGLLPAETIITEHYKLGSTMAILSRTFFDQNMDDISKANERFSNGINKIREFENSLLNQEQEYFDNNYEDIKNKVKMIVNKINEKKD